MAPPGTPAERVNHGAVPTPEALQDSEVAAEITKSKLDREPSTGEEIEKIFKGLMTQPREVIDRVKKIDEN